MATEEEIVGFTDLRKLNALVKDKESQGWVVVGGITQPRYGGFYSAKLQREVEDDGQ
jgi:hypothetical protein